MAPVHEGVELIVGAGRDPRFGPVAAVGLGGIYTEIFGDVAVGLAPLDVAEAERMLFSLRGAPLLAGARGRPAVRRPRRGGGCFGALARRRSASRHRRDRDRSAARHAGRAVALDARVIEIGGTGCWLTAAFDGQVAVVTGGGTGMGRAMALEFSRLGAAVVVAGRRAEPLAETAALIEGSGGTALAEPDGRARPGAGRGADARRRRHLRPDRLPREQRRRNFVVKAEDLSPNGWRAVTSIVLDGSFLCAQAAGKRMMESGEGGAIVSVIASYAWTGGPGTVHSAAAKAGVMAMTKTLAVEWAPHGIRVNTICPGPTATEGAGAALWPTPEDEGRVASSVPIGRLARVEEIAWWTTALCCAEGRLHHRRQPDHRRRPLVRSKRATWALKQE